jgi:hypothetical protein
LHKNHYLHLRIALYTFWFEVYSYIFEIKIGGQELTQGRKSNFWNRMYDEKSAALRKLIKIFHYEDQFDQRVQIDRCNLNSFYKYLLNE